MRQKELLIISVIVFLTILAWIVADIYHISTTQKITPIETPASTMKTTVIDTSVLDVLQSKTDE